MLKSLAPATAIALALGLQGCATASNVDLGDIFSSQGAVNANTLRSEMAVADAALSAGDTAGAIRIYRHLARAHPNALQPRLKLGDALLRAGAVQEAAFAYKGAVRLRPASFEARAGLGRVEIALHQPGAALNDFNRAAEMNGEDAMVQNGRAVALDQLGRHTEAQAVYLKLLEKDPSNQKLRSNYAMSLALAGKYDDAADILTSLAQAPDAEPRVRENLAYVYGLAGNDGQAAHASRKDLDEDAIRNNVEYYQRLRNQNSALRSAPLSGPSTAPVLGPTSAKDAAVESENMIAEHPDRQDARANAAPPPTLAPVTVATIAPPVATAAAPAPAAMTSETPQPVAAKAVTKAKTVSPKMKAGKKLASATAKAKAVSIASVSAPAHVRVPAVPAAVPQTATDLAADLQAHRPAPKAASTAALHGAHTVAQGKDDTDGAKRASNKTAPHPKRAEARPVRTDTAEIQGANPLDAKTRLPAVL